MQLINLQERTLDDSLFSPSVDVNDSAPTRLTPNWHLHMVSDSSELAQHMTFDWALCLNDGTRLALCSGPAFGKGSSHRAEATGMLSGARFLYHLTQYCDQPINRPTTFTTDNKGLLTRIRQRNEYDTNFVTVTLAPDWDRRELYWLGGRRGVGHGRHPRRCRRTGKDGLGGDSKNVGELVNGVHLCVADGSKGRGRGWIAEGQTKVDGGSNGSVGG
jgi:hypothetical protein